MKIVVTGSSGMLGTAVMAHLKELGRDAVGVDLIHPDASRRLDVSDWQAVSAFAPLRDCGLLLHLAAATDVDRCENEPDLLSAPTPWPRNFSHGSAPNATSRWFMSARRLSSPAIIRPDPTLNTTTPLP